MRTCSAMTGLCQYVRENETAINTAHREVDEMAYDLLAKEQPMAIDLRFILAVIKINGDLERIGDQAMSIALRSLRSDRRRSSSICPSTSAAWASMPAE